MPKRSRYDAKTIQQIKVEYDSGLSLQVVAAAHGMSYSNLHYIFEKRGWALRDGGAHRHTKLKEFDETGITLRLQPWRQLDSNAKGAIAEHLASIWLMSHGLDVWRPSSQHHCCDLGVLLGNSVVRCQVKVAAFSQTNKLFDVHLKTNSNRKYHADHVDFFLVYCPGLELPVFYVLPVGTKFPGDRARFYPHRQHFQTNTNWEQFRDAIHLIKGPN